MFGVRRLSGREDGGGGEEGVVHGAGAVAFGVESDVEKAEGLNGCSDFFESWQR